MTRESLLKQDWSSIVARLGGAATLEALARETKVFMRPREIRNAVDLLRLVLAYCQAGATARRKARREAQREGRQLSKHTLEAADWVILVACGSAVYERRYSRPLPLALAHRTRLQAAEKPDRPQRAA